MGGCSGREGGGLLLDGDEVVLGALGLAREPVDDDVGGDEGVAEGVVDGAAAVVVGGGGGGVGGAVEGDGDGVAGVSHRCGGVG